MMRGWSRVAAAETPAVPPKTLVNVAFNGAGARYHAFFGAAAAVADCEHLDVGRVFGMSSGFVAALLLAGGIPGSIIREKSAAHDMREILATDTWWQRLRAGGLQSTRAIGRAIDAEMEILGFPNFGALPPPPVVVREVLAHDAPWRVCTRSWAVANDFMNRAFLGLPRSLDIALANLVATDVRSKDGRARESVLMGGAYSLPLPQALVPLYVRQGHTERWALDRIDAMRFSEIVELTMALPIVFPNGVLRDLPQYRWLDGAIHERHLADVWGDGHRLSDAQGENWYFRLAGNYPDRLPALVFGITQPNKAGMTSEQLHELRLTRMATYTVELNHCGVRLRDFRNGAMHASELFERAYETTHEHLHSDAFAEYCATQRRLFDEDFGRAVSVTQQVDDMTSRRRRVIPPGFMRKWLAS